MPPVHPSWSPFGARNPDPHVTIHDPAAIVEGDQPPRCLGGVFDPVPAPIVGMYPMTHGIGPPVPCHIGWNPDIAPSGMALPCPIGFKRRPELDGDGFLRLSRGKGAENNRRRCKQRGA